MLIWIIIRRLDCKGPIIQTFLDKGLAELFESGETSKINKIYHLRLLERLSALDAAPAVSDMNVPGWQFHALSGFKPTRYSVHVNGPRCLTFEFDMGHAYRVDFVQYH